MADGNVGTLYYTVEADTSKVVNSVSPVEKSIKRVEKELDNLDKSFDGVEKSSKSAGKAIKDVGDKGQDAGNKLKPVPKAISEIGTASSGAAGSLGAFTKVFAGLLTLSMGKTLLEMADSYNEYAERVRMATDSVAEFEYVQARLLDTSNNTYRALSESQEMYIRTADSLRSMGYSTGQALDITDSLTYAFVKNAASSDKAASAVDAYSKAVIKGKVDSDAWVTITNAIPSVIDDVAKAAGLSAEQIRKLGAEGKITANQLNEGLRQSLDANKAAADGMATTMNDAFRAFGNNLSKFLGEANQSVGVTRALSESIIFLSKHIQELATFIGIVGGIQLAKYVAALGASAIAQIKFALNSVKTTAALATEASAMQKVATAATGYAAATTASAAGTTAMGAAAAATAGRIGTLASGLGMVGGAIRVVAGLLSGPVGIIAALGLTALSFVDFGSGADIASKSLLDMAAPLDQTIAKIRQLNQEQLNTEKIKFEVDSKKSLEDATVALNNFVNGMEITTARGTKHMAQLRGEMRTQLQAIVSDTSLSTEQIATGLKMLADEWQAQAGWTDATKQKYLELADSFIKAQGDANKMAQVLEALQQQLDAGAGAVTNLNQTFADLDPGMDKWDEYLKKLTDARDMIGMNARELGEFQAAQADANAVQQEMAGIVTAQADEFRKLQKAIEDKDVAAAAAATSNIRNLDIERQRVALLAEQTATLMAVVQNFAKAGIASDVQAGVLINLNKWFEKRFKDIKVSSGIEAQIGRVLTNTKPGKTGGGAGGGSGSGAKSEAQRAAEADVKALQAVRREIELNKLAGEDLAQAKARDKLSQYATPEQVAMMQQLTSELYKQEQLKKLRDKVGDDTNKYIDGNLSPLSGGVFDDQVARYEAEAKVEQQRYTDQLIRLREAKEAQLLTQQEYNDKFEQMAQTHADRVSQIEAAKYSVLLSTGENAFASLAGVLKDAQGEQSSAYKAMFAVSKGFAIANAAVAMGVALSEAWKLPWPANLAAAGVAAANMATIMANIQSVGATFGGGRQYGGSVDPSKMYRVNEGGKPELFNMGDGQQYLLPNSRGQVVSNEDATRADGSGGMPKVTVNLHKAPAGTVVQQRQIDRELIIDVLIEDEASGGRYSQARDGMYGLRRTGR